MNTFILIAALFSVTTAQAENYLDACSTGEQIASTQFQKSEDLTGIEQKCLSKDYSAVGGDYFDCTRCATETFEALTNNALAIEGEMDQNPFDK